MYLSEEPIALASQNAEHDPLEAAVHETVQHGVLRRVGVSEQHGEWIEGDEVSRHGGVKVEAEVDDVVGKPAGGEENREDDHHQRQATSRQHLQW